MAYEGFEDLTRRIASDKILRYIGLDITKNSKYDGYERGFTLMFHKFFDKKTSGGRIKNETIWRAIQTNY